MRNERENPFTRQVAHPLMLRAIAAAKKKNDRIGAKKICDCLRCDFLPRRYTWPRRRFASGGAAPQRGFGVPLPV